MTPFLLFAKEMRPKLAAQNPDKKLTEVAKMVGQQYKLLSEVEKGNYKASYKGLQDQYKNEMEKLKS